MSCYAVSKRFFCDFQVFQSVLIRVTGLALQYTHQITNALHIRSVCAVQNYDVSNLYCILGMRQRVTSALETGHLGHRGGTLARRLPWLKGGRAQLYVEVATTCTAQRRRRPSVRLALLGGVSPAIALVLQGLRSCTSRFAGALQELHLHFTRCRVALQGLQFTSGVALHFQGLRFQGLHFQGLHFQRLHRVDRGSWEVFDPDRPSRSRPSAPRPSRG